MERRIVWAVILICAGIVGYCDPQKTVKTIQQQADPLWYQGP